MKIFKNLILFFLFAFVYSFLFSQQIKNKAIPSIVSFLPEEYHSHAQVWTIIQDNRGVMYFGTTESIVEYDGTYWKNIFSSNVSIIRSFAKDSNGVIYVGAVGDFGFLASDSIGNTVFYSLAKKLGVQDKDFNDVWETVTTKNGIYFRSSKKLFRYNPANDDLKIWSPPESISFNPSFAMPFGNNDFIIRIDNQFYKVVNDQFVALPGSNILKNYFIYKLLPYSNHQFLCLTYNKVFIYDLSVTRGEPVSTFSEKLNQEISEANIYMGCKLNNNKFVINSRSNGAYVIDSKGNILEKIDESSSLNDNYVWYSYSDNQGVLWLGLNNGITSVEINSPFRTWDKKTGFNESSNDIIAFGNSIYLATMNGIYQKQNGGDYYHQNEFILVPGSKNEYWKFLSFYDTDLKKPRLLVTSSTGLAEIMEKKIKVLKSGKHIYNIAQSKINKKIIFLVSASKFEAIQLQGSRIEEMGSIDLQGVSKYYLEDSSKNIWIGTTNSGIYKIEPNLSINADTLKYQKSGIFLNSKVSLYGTINGLPDLIRIKPFFLDYEVLFGTSDGIYKYNNQKDRFEEETELNQRLHCKKVKVDDIVKDKDGIYYVVSEKQIYKLNKVNNEYIVDSLTFKRINSRTKIYCEDSNVWIAGMGNLIQYNSRVENDTSIKFNTLIRKVISGNNTVVFQGNNYFNRLSKRDQFDLDQVNYQVPVFDYQHNSLIFLYSAPYFISNKDIKYSYKLEGYQENWAPWSSETKKEYTNLSEGHYIFKVKGKNIFNVESTTAQYEFIIEPPLYRTWIAYFLYVLLLFLIVFISIKYYTKLLIKQKQKLEKIVKQRTTDVVKQKEEIQTQAQKLELANHELEKLSIVASETDNSVTIADANGNLEWVNEGFTRMYGYTFEDLMNLNFRTLFDFSITPDIKENVEYCLKNKKSRIYESLNLTKRGENIWAQTTITPILDKSGDIKKIIAIDSDITKLKLAEIEILQHKSELEAQRDYALQQKEFIEIQNIELEQHRSGLEKIVHERTAELEIAKEKAEESDRLKSAFLANMSHEIRTPMNAIIGFSNLLVEEEITDSEREKYIKQIVHNSSSLLHLIDDIINISIIEAGQVSVKNQVVNINKLFHELFQVYSVKISSIIDKEIILIPEVDKIEETLNLFTDPTHVIEILSNLLDNAIKFTEKGIIHFGYDLIEQDGTLFIRCFVKDSGTGLTPEQQKHLFIHFSKVHESKEKLYRGAGLGLSICKNLVELLGGKIWVDSKINVGSSFYFTLPFQNTSSIKALDEGEKANDIKNLNGKIVLIAEDEESNFQYLVAALSKTHVQILRANNGMEAIEIVKNTPVDLIFMDIKMPKMNGLEATRIIKEMGKNIPIIAQTAFAFETDQISSYQSGCDAYILKPINKSKLFDLLYRYIK